MSNQMKVYLVTWGSMSESVLVCQDQVQDFLKSIPKEERRCALITETDLDPSDLDLINRTQTIIKRAENEITEAKMNLGDRLRNRNKRGA